MCRYGVAANLLETYAASTVHFVTAVSSRLSATVERETRHAEPTTLQEVLAHHLQLATFICTTIEHLTSVYAFPFSGYQERGFVDVARSFTEGLTSHKSFDCHCKTGTFINNLNNVLGSKKESYTL